MRSKSKWCSLNSKINSENGYGLRVGFLKIQIKTSLMGGLYYFDDSIDLSDMAICGRMTI